jgi:hypothetical protein
MSDLIGITPQEVARQACDLNISGRVESLVELVKWAQAQITRAAGVAVEMKAAKSGPCECRKCLEGKAVDIGGMDVPLTMSRMIVCEACGNKRCPHANDHRNACTGSNVPGQPGSAYP